ncbi:hypothetical protein CRUP_035733, partial [Coryphaenoides rupestris]
TGYRSVPLTNGYSESLELASLLIYINVEQVGETQEELYSSSGQLQKKTGGMMSSGSEPFLYDGPSPRLTRQSSTNDKQRVKKINNSKFY